MNPDQIINKFEGQGRDKYFIPTIGEKRVISRGEEEKMYPTVER